jgi:hypothetical protein
VLAVRLLLLTGARRDEILGLCWEDVDLDTGTLNLPDSKTGKKSIPLGAGGSEPRGIGGAAPRPAVLRASAKQRWLPTRFPGRDSGSDAVAGMRPVGLPPTAKAGGAARTWQETRRKAATILWSDDWALGEHRAPRLSRCGAASLHLEPLLSPRSPTPPSAQQCGDHAGCDARSGARAHRRSLPCASVSQLSQPGRRGALARAMTPDPLGGC